MPPKRSPKGTSQPPQKDGREPAAKTKGHAKYTEEDMEKALYACSDSNPQAVSIGKAAKEYGIPPATLSARKRGNKPRKEAHMHQQQLSPKEEEALAIYCQSKGWRGEPLGIADIRALASDICGKKVGENWVYKFMKRHPELRTRWAKAGESKRASGLNRGNVESFYKALAKAREGVDADCIWNCDEKGLVENGGTVRTRVIVGSDQRDPKVTADESRKMVTIIECVNAVGGAISPLVIHEGAEKDAEWIRSNPCGAHLASSPNGWTDGNIFHEWFQDVFVPETEVVAQGRKQLLIVDGHNSHCGLDVILYAVQRNITILLLPPHTTHRLQPLDVNVFSHLARSWKKKVKEMNEKGYVIRKNNLISVYSIARREALTENNIRTAFRQCGIEPFDPSIITEEHMAAAERTSATASQPIPPTLAPCLDRVQRPARQPQQPAAPPAASQDANVAPDAAGVPPHPLPAPLRDTTNLLPKPPLQGLRVRRNNRPTPPSEHAPKAELQKLVKQLYTLLDEDTEQLAASYAREVLANHENGQLRERAHGKKGGRAKTVHLKTGARILTGADSIAAMAAVDQKKVLGMVMKDVKPIAKHREKFETALGKETEGKQVQRETAEIEAAKKRKKAAEKEQKSVQDKIKTARNMLTNAMARLRDARTPAAQRKAEESCEIHRLKIATQNKLLLEISARLNEATVEYDELCGKRERRLNAIKAAEDKFNAAVAAEEEEKQKEEEKKRKELGAAIQRRAQLPQRLKEPGTVWKGRMEVMELSLNDIPESQEGCYLPDTMPKLKPGTFVNWLDWTDGHSTPTKLPHVVPILASGGANRVNPLASGWTSVLEHENLDVIFEIVPLLGELADHGNFSEKMGLSIPSIISGLDFWCSEAIVPAASLLGKLSEHGNHRKAIALAIPSIITLLERRNLAVVFAAMSLLGTLAKHDSLCEAVGLAIPSLIELHGHDTMAVRSAAASLLGNLVEHNNHREAIALAIPYIITLLERKNLIFVFAAMSLLRKLAKHDSLCEAVCLAIPSLIGLHGHETMGVRLAAASLLGNLVEHSKPREAPGLAIPSLIRLLEHWGSGIQLAAASLFGKLVGLSLFGGGR